MCLICCCWGTVRALAFGEPLGSPTKGRCPLATPVQVGVMQRIG